MHRIFTVNQSLKINTVTQYILSMHICSMTSNSNSNAGKRNVKLKNSNNNAEEEHNFKIQTIAIISMNYLFDYFIHTSAERYGIHKKK